MIHTIKLSSGRSVRCLAFGNGKRPFVILPGLSMTGVLERADHHERSYRLFTETHTVYLFDRPYDYPSGYTFEKMASDLAEAMESAGIREADMLGVSMGGMLAQAISADHPQLVRKLVLASSSLSIGRPDRLKAWMKLAESESGNTVAAAIMKDIQGGPDGPDAVYHPDPALNEWRPEDRARFLQEAEIALSFDGNRYAPRIQCPTLVIGAAGDRVCPVEAWKRLADVLKCESFLYGKAFGHTFYTEAADFKSRVLDFFLRFEQKLNDRPLVWDCGPEKELISTPVFDLYSREETSADGCRGTYIALKAPGWVMTVPVVGDSFVMVRQWRHGMQALTDEFPGGICDGNETPEQCAARELEEETGYRAGKITVLGSCCPNPALQDNRVTVCLAENLDRSGELLPDSDERIGVRLVSRRDLIRDFGSYDYQHALTGLALFLYLRHTGFQEQEADAET